MSWTPPDELQGVRILLILISRDGSRAVQFLVGRAQRASAGFQIVTDARESVSSLDWPADQRRTFDAAVLPRLILPEAYALVHRLGKGVTLALPIFADDAIEGALTLRNPFFGLASSARDEPLLMQGPEMNPPWHPAVDASVVYLPPREPRAQVRQR